MTIRKRPDRGTWEVQLKYTLNGRPTRIRESFITKGEAEKRERELRETVARAKAAERLGLLAAPVVGGAVKRRTWNNWWLACLVHAETTVRPTSLARKKNIGTKFLSPAFGELSLIELTPARIELAQDRWLADGASPATVVRIRAELRWAIGRAMELLEGEGEAPVRNPLDRCRPPKVRSPKDPWTFLDGPEREAYLAALAGEPEPWATLLLCALDAGLRRGELVALRWPHVDLERGLLRVQASISPATLDGERALHAGSPKSGRARIVGLTDRLAKALRGLGSRFAGGPVFLDGDQAVHPDQPIHPHERTLARAKITRHVRLHDLRHTWASHLAMAGVPLATIQQLGGWGSAAMVARYAHLSTESVVDAVKKLEPDGATKRATKVDEAGKGES